MRILPRNRFSFESPLTADEARHQIRAKLDQRPVKSDHVWGLAVGRLVWIMHTVGSMSPTAWAWISDRPEGVTISGFARVSLAFYVLLSLGFAIVLGRIFLFDRADPFWVLGFLAFLLIGTMWADHIWYRDGDLLVRKLRQAVDAEQLPDADENELSPAVHIAEPDPDLVKNELALEGASLTFDGVRAAGCPSQKSLADAVARLDLENFVIVEFDDQDYMQAAQSTEGFLVEFRKGGPEAHFHSRVLVDRDSTLAAMSHYLATREPHPRFTWQAGMRSRSS